MAKNKRTPKGRIDDARKSADADWEVEKTVAVATGKDSNRYLGRATERSTTPTSQKRTWPERRSCWKISVRSVQRRPVPMQK